MQDQSNRDTRTSCHLDVMQIILAKDFNNRRCCDIIILDNQVCENYKTLFTYQNFKYLIFMILQVIIRKCCMHTSNFKHTWYFIVFSNYLTDH